MPRSSKFRTAKPLVLLLPLLVGGVAWWLAEQNPSASALTEPPVSKVAAASSQPPEVKAAPVIQGSYGLAVTPLPADEIFSRFDAWAANYARDAKAQDLAEGVQLAGQRRVALKTLIQEKPQEALARALPWRLRNRMPQAVTDLLEARISARAEYSVKGAAKVPGSAAMVEQIQRDVILDGKIYDAYVYGRREWIGTKYGLPVEGIALDKSLAMLERPIREMEPEEPTPANGIQKAAQDEHQTATSSAAPPPPLVSGGTGYQACCPSHAKAMEQAMNAEEERLGPNMGSEVAESAWTEGHKDVLVIRVDFSDRTGTPENINPVVTLTPAFATNLINGVTNTFMTEVSYGKTSVSLNSADVTPVLRMPRTAAFYAVNDEPDQLRLDCLAAATAVGYTPSNYERQMVVFSWIGTSKITGSQFSWAGLGQINAPFTWYNAYFDDRVVPHELGHNLSLYHANLWQVTGSNPVALTGSYSSEYADPFDGMGNGFYAPINLLHFNPWFLNRIDWLPNSAVTTASGPGLFRIYRYDRQSAPLNRPLALKVTKDGTRNYWLSYRRKFAGISGGLADISAGAYVIWGFNTNRQSQLIDVSTPGVNANDASLNVGSTLRDEQAGIIFRAVSSGTDATGEYLDIRVDQDNRVYPLQQTYDVDEAAGSVTISLVRSGEPNETTIVNVATEDFTAVAPSDYTAVSTTLQWTGTDVSPKTVTIPIVSDANREPAESFRVHITLQSSPTVLVSGSPVTVNIREPGMADPSFSHNTFDSVGSVRQMVIEPDGQTAFVGGVTYLGASSLEGLGRVSETGAVDATFNRTFGADVLPVRTLVRQADGRFVVGGDFTFIRGQFVNRVARIENDGGVDTGFDPGAGANGEVRALALQADGKILVGGVFTAFDGVSRRGLARLNSDGSLDTGFMATALPHINGMVVEQIGVQPDGKILVAGLIHTAERGQLFEGISCGVLRLNANGSVDMSFDIGYGAHLAGNEASPQRVTALALQSDGKVIVGGAFTAFNGANATRLARLNTNGTLDMAFQTALGANGVNGLVRSIVVQGDGRIVLGGEFTGVSNVARTYVGRLLSSGALDTSFDAQLPVNYSPGQPSFVHQVLMLPDGRLQLALEGPGSGNTTIRRVFSGQQGRSGVVEFVNGSASVNEGGQASIEVRRTGGSLGAVSVSYALQSGSAGADDYVETSGTLTWNSGDSAPKSIFIEAVSDSEPEETEFFNVLLGVPTGGVSLGERAISTVAIMDPGAAGFPTVSFTGDSSTLAEGAGAPITLTVQLSQAASEPVIVPVVRGGSAANSDYSVSTSLPLIFAAGQTSKTITISSVQDSAIEGNETITLKLGFPTGPALLGTPALHTISLIDDDLPPTIIGSPAHRIVALGAMAGPFEVNLTGSQPMTVEWTLNGRKIPGATTSSYSIPNVGLAHSGAYVLKAKNSLAEAFSTTAEVVVVDASVKTVVVPVGSKVTFKVSSAGPNIGHVWRMEGNAALGSNPRVSNLYDKSFTISGLTLEDSGTYFCRVSSPIASKPNGEKFMDGGIHILKVVDQVPVIEGLEDGDFLPPAVVSGSYDFQVEIDETVRKAAMTFTAKGLPTGLKIDAATGRITGKPTVFKSTAYDITLTAGNKAGADTVKVKLMVDPLPTHLAGDYIALVSRHPGLNQNIGGRLDLKITPTGAFTGKLVHGGLSHSLKGVMDVIQEDSTPPVALPSARVVIVRTGKPTPRPLKLFFEINPTTKRISSASITDDFDTVTFDGWKQTWDAKTNKPDAFDGYYTFALEMLDSIPNVPKGYGYGSINVSLAGMATFAGTTGDGEKLAGSSFISPDGDVLFFQQLYKTKPVGSLLGKLRLEHGASETNDNDNRISGFLNWLRPETTTANARVYKAGFGPLDVTAFGGRYLPQTLALGVTAGMDVSVNFSDAGISGASRNPNATFDLVEKNKLTPPTYGLAATTLKPDVAKGGFTGKFTLEDSNPRSPPPTVKRAVTYQGMVVPTEAGLKGYGYFVLPQLPTLVPATTPTTSPILSGKVFFQAVQPD